MPLTRTTKLIIFTGVACGGLLLFTALFSNDGLLSEPVFRPKEGEIVALYSKHSGKYLEVSQEDGKMRATASKPVNKSALFRVMLLPPAVVDILIDAANTANSAEWSRRRHWTGPRFDENGTAMPEDKGCQCSGYSNDHGFGAFCFGWEYESQTPWCATAARARTLACCTQTLSLYHVCTLLLLVLDRARSHTPLRRGRAGAT